MSSDVPEGPARAPDLAAPDPIGPPALLALLALPLLFYRLGSPGLVHLDEGIYHRIALQIARSGDWFSLVLDGEPRIYDTFMNAPLQYWARAALILAFGDNYWTMRGLSAAFGLASLGITYRLGWRVGGARAGLLAGLVQLFTYQFLYMHGARTGVLEPVACFLLTSIAYLFLSAADGRRSFSAHHLCLALLVLVKTPLVLVPCAAELALFALLPDLRRAFRPWLRWLPLAALGLGWHLLQLWWLGDAGQAALARMAGKASGQIAGKHGSALGHLGFYAAALCYGAYPQVLTWPFALAQAWRDRALRALERGVLLAYPAALIAFFLLIEAAYDWYLMPIQPFAAVLVGLWIDRALRGSGRGAALGFACVFSGLAWIRTRDGNPFAERAWSHPGAIGWRDSGPLPPEIGVPLTTALLGVGFYFLWRRGGPRLRQLAAAAVALALLGSAGLRVAAPLRFVGSVSEMEQQARALRASRLRGEALEFPIPVRERGLLRARFFFGADFEIEVARGRDRRDGVHFWLVSERARNRPAASAGSGPSLPPAPP